MPQESAYTGHIILRLSSALVEALAEKVRSSSASYGDLREAFDDLTAGQDMGISDLGVALDRWGVRAPPLITSISQERLVHLEDVAGASPSGRRFRLLAYWRLDARRIPGRLSLVRTLNSSAIPAVDVAYLEPGLLDPAVNPGQNPLSGSQGYLDAAPSGVDAYEAWKLGWTGNGIGFVDLEMGWHLEHVDIVDHLKNAQATGTYGAGDERDFRFFNDNYVGKWALCGFEHGTNVLGIVVGTDDTCGIVGLAPEARAGVVSRYRADVNDVVQGSPTSPSGDADYWQVAQAVVAALDPAHPRSLKKGGILLLEVQTQKKLPVETVSHIFDAIKVAIGNGVSVIEAAGNGGFDLDEAWVGLESPGDPHPQILDRTDPAFTDSGAIVVAGGGDGTQFVGADAKGTYEGHPPWPDSNYGSRIDCYAWAEKVTTAAESYGSPGSVYSHACTAAVGATTCDTQYTDAFGGTSAASAIVAGCALLVQEMAGGSLGPAAMREILSGPGRKEADARLRVTNGTGYAHVADGKGIVKKIGVMPDLAKLAAHPGVLGAPDPYVRDSYQDIGIEPSPGAFQSPDILVRNVSAANVAGLDPFAAEPANPTSPLPNDPVAKSADNHVFVRVHNASPVPASGTRVRVFWSEVATLLTSDQWHELGGPGVAPPTVDVPGDASATIAIPWDATSAANRPASGHGCLVAVLDHDADPAPDLIDWDTVGPGDPQFWDLFKSWVTAENNIAWRNFNVVSDAAALQKTTWFLRGAPDRARVFRVEIEHFLPPDLELWWSFPAELSRELGRAGLGDAPERIEGEARGAEEGDGAGRGAAIARLSRPRVRLSPLRLARRADHPCRFLLRRRTEPLETARWAAGRERKTSEPPEIRIRQFHGQDEVGRITWQLVGPTTKRGARAEPPQPDAEGEER